MTFGDDGPDDAYDPTARADPGQVARRWHEDAKAEFRGCLLKLELVRDLEVFRIHGIRKHD